MPVTWTIAAVGGFFGFGVQIIVSLLVLRLYRQQEGGTS